MVKSYANEYDDPNVESNFDKRQYRILASMIAGVDNDKIINAIELLDYRVVRIAERKSKSEIGYEMKKNQMNKGVKHSIHLDVAFKPKYHKVHIGGHEDVDFDDGSRKLYPISRHGSLNTELVKTNLLEIESLLKNLKLIEEGGIDRYFGLEEWSIEYDKKLIADPSFFINKQSAKSNTINMSKL